MWMTEFDIKQSFRLAKVKGKQIMILAELNGVTKEQIRNILVDELLAAKNQEDLKLHNLYSQNFTDKEIAIQIGHSSGYVRAWRRRNDLKNNFKLYHELRRGRKPQ